ncbi:MAG: hypothetical protein ACLQF2_05050, partial [Rhodomicrobium sp.]
MVASRFRFRGACEETGGAGEDGVTKRQVVRAALLNCRWGGRMGVAIMVIGLAVFLGSHTLVTLRPQRAAL